MVALTWMLPRVAGTKRGKDNQVMFMSYCLYNKQENCLMLLTAHISSEGYVFDKSFLNSMGPLDGSPQGPWFKGSSLWCLVRFLYCSKKGNFSRNNHFFVSCCHSFSLAVTRTPRCYSLSLFVTPSITRLSFYKWSNTSS